MDSGKTTNSILLVRCHSYGDTLPPKAFRYLPPVEAMVDRNFACTIQDRVFRIEQDHHWLAIHRLRWEYLHCFTSVGIILKSWNYGLDKAFCGGILIRHAESIMDVVISCNQIT